MCHASALFRPVNADVGSISTSRRCQPDVGSSDREPGKHAFRLPSFVFRLPQSTKLCMSSFRGMHTGWYMTAHLAVVWTT